MEPPRGWYSQQSPLRRQHNVGNSFCCVVDDGDNNGVDNKTATPVALSNLWGWFLAVVRAVSPRKLLVNGWQQCRRQELDDGLDDGDNNVHGVYGDCFAGDDAAAGCNDAEAACDDGANDAAGYGRLESRARVDDAGVGESGGGRGAGGGDVDGNGGGVVGGAVVLDWCEWSLSWIHLVIARLRTFSAVRGQCKMNGYV